MGGSCGYASGEKTSTRPVGHCPTALYGDYRRVVVRGNGGTTAGFARPRRAVKPQRRVAARRNAELDRESADRAIINDTAASQATIEAVLRRVLVAARSARPRRTTMHRQRCRSPPAGLAECIGPAMTPVIFSTAPERKPGTPVRQHSSCEFAGHRWEPAAICSHFRRSIAGGLRPVAHDGLAAFIDRHTHG